MQASSLHPVVMVLMIITIILIFVLPRKYVIVPFLITVFLTPWGQQIYVAGGHFFLARILILFGLARMFWSKLTTGSEIASGGFNSIDTVFFWWAILRSSATFLEFLQIQAAVNQCGFLIDWLGGYFLLRFLVRDDEDMLRIIKLYAFLAIVFALTMIIEHMAARNVFGYIGGRVEPFVRDGAIRSQATFLGPIPAGTFAATLVCLLAWLWQSGKGRLLAALGLIGASIMVVTSASSTPILTYGGAILGISMWPARTKMRVIRWGMFLILLTAHLTMKAPVWFLINHIELVAGNSGYHRATLIDAFVRHFSEWWLIGVRTTASWGWDMWDQANQFVAEGESGGLAAFICFILLIARSFGRLGRARKLVDGDRNKEWQLWLLGAALFSYVVSFFGISFSDQSTFAWLALLAMISAVTAPVLAPRLTPDNGSLIEVPPVTGMTLPQVARTHGNRRLDSPIRK